MSAANMILPIVATVRARERKRIRAYFYAQHAVSAEDAVPYAATSGVAQDQFRWMRDKGIVRETAPGYFWFDRAAWDVEDAARRRVLIPVAFVLLLALAAIPLFFYKG